MEASACYCNFHHQMQTADLCTRGHTCKSTTLMWEVYVVCAMCIRSIVTRLQAPYMNSDTLNQVWKGSILKENLLRPFYIPHKYLLRCPSIFMQIPLKSLLILFLWYYNISVTCQSTLQVDHGTVTSLVKYSTLHVVNIRTVILYSYILVIR